jgi:heme A synthase
MAIPDFPLSYGHVLPPIDGSALPTINDYRLGWDLSPVTMSQIWIHFAHRVGALLVSLLLLMNVSHVLSSYKDSKLREPALLLLAGLLVQILLGALTVWTGKGVEVATAHVAVGALLLGLSVVVSIRSFQMYRVPEKAFSTNLVPEASRP